MDVHQPTELTSNEVSVSDVICFGQSNGSAEVEGVNGTPGYTYSWDNGQTGTSLTNLSAGSYVCTITDDNGCTDNITVQVNQPDELTITLTETDVTCFGDDNGEINANVQGGITTSPYNYIWSSDIGVNPPPSDFIDGLAPGTYTLNVLDANNCLASDQVQITEPAVLSSNVVNIDSTLCFGSNDGAAEVTGIDGTPNYSYSWSDGQTNALATGLSAGQYVCTITDFNGCSTNISVDVHQPTLLTSSEVNVSNVSCFGGNDGSAEVTGINGTPGYTYSWDNGQTNALATGLSAGSYVCTITDFNGCSTNISVDVHQPTLNLLPMRLVFLMLFVLDNPMALLK